jgi:hypothetical protein
MDYTMSLEDELHAVFAKNEWTWNLKGNRKVIPTAQDIEAALDEAARLLYNEPVGTQLEVGRLIIRKQPRGHDVYIFVGPYE